MAADLFCGAGGFSSALLLACKSLDIDVELLAVNHWDIAIATHQLNHPEIRHLQADLGGINPRNTIPGGHLDLLVASPECTHHSRARGGKPMNDQSRATAFCVLRWAEAIDIDNILIENVSEFEQWGPLYPDDHPDPKKAGRPIPSKRGQLFQHFIKGLRILGYTVQYQRLNAAYFGAATSRERLFIQAVKKRRKIIWPQPTHSPTPDLFGNTKKFRAARECIDFSVPSQSIFGRKKDLRPNTMARVWAGMKKHNGLDFVLGQQSCSAPRDLDQPLPTISTAGAISLVQPFLVVLRRNADGRSLNEPLPTICAGGGHLMLAEPFLLRYQGNHANRDSNERLAQSLDKPIGTLDTSNRYGLVQPFIVPVTHSGGEGRVHDLDKPLPTVTGAHRGEMALVEPFIVPVTHSKSGNITHSVEQPLKTITTAKGGEFALVEPFLVKFKNNSDSCSLDKPFDTLTTKDVFGLAQPFLLKYYGNETGATSVDEPLPTCTTKARFALVEPHVLDQFNLGPDEELYLLDIHLRMLKPHELAKAMGFPDDYKFIGTQEQKVKQIGNAVEVNVAQALIATMLQPYALRCTKQETPLKAAA
jgi:DNA (cytosine-5)-methyltransferase 1